MSPIRIVVVDDVADLRVVVRKSLEMDGRFEVVGDAEDARSAITVVGETKPDVVMLDVAMPGMTGLEAIPEIRSASPETKIAVFTVKGESARQEVLDAGADAYIPKYESFDEVIERLLEVVDT